MKYLGLDLGSRTLGLAISDALGMFARAYDTLRFENDDYDYAINETINICKKEGINEIEEKSDIKVHLLDERLTTVRVDKAMIMGNMSRQKRHQKKDEMAAVVILQDFLDSKH